MQFEDALFAPCADDAATHPGSVMHVDGVQALDDLGAVSGIGLEAARSVDMDDLGVRQLNAMATLRSVVQRVVNEDLIYPANLVAEIGTCIGDDRQALTALETIGHSLNVHLAGYSGWLSQEIRDIAPVMDPRNSDLDAGIAAMEFFAAMESFAATQYGLRAGNEMRKQSVNILLWHDRGKTKYVENAACNFGVEWRNILNEQRRLQRR